MKKLPWVGLVFTGSVSRSGIERIPRLYEQLGWIKSNTIASASRAANRLKAGRAVRDYESLSKAELILMHSPEDSVDVLVDGMLSSGVHWPGKHVAVFHPVLDHHALDRLRAAGASAGSFWILSESPLKFVVEGDSEALKRLRRLLRTPEILTIEIACGSKPQYLAGVHAATTAFLPLLAKSIDNFQRAGMGKGEAEATAASLVESAVRAYLRVGTRLLSGAAGGRPAAGYR